MKTIKLGKDIYDYKSFVGPKQLYDIIGLIQFSLLTFYGLKPEDKVLDIGCGSLRLGKYLMEYLDIGNYFAIEPNEWLVEEALKNEKIENKDNVILNGDNNFNLKIFRKKFNWIIANSIFIHSSLEQFKTCVDQAYKVLNKSGEFFFNYIEGKEDNKKGEWSYPNSVAYKKETLKKIVEEKRFVWKDIDWPYPGKQKWVKLYKENINFKEDCEE